MGSTEGGDQLKPAFRFIEPLGPARRSFKEGDIVCLRANESYEACVVIPHREFLKTPYADYAVRNRRRRVKVLWPGGHQQWLYEDDLRYPDAIAELGRLA